MSDPTPAEERPRLVVLFGDQSAEHDVSRVTARHVLAALDHERFDVVPVGISREGEWVLADAAARALLEGTEALAERLPDALAVEGPTDLAANHGEDDRTHRRRYALEECARAFVEIGIVQPARMDHGPVEMILEHFLEGPGDGALLA